MSVRPGTPSATLAHACSLPNCRTRSSSSFAVVSAASRSQSVVADAVSDLTGSRRNTVYEKALALRKESRKESS